MLKGISPIISPDLLKILMEMGHGDEIVIADGNFPGAALARNLVRLDGHGVPEVIDAVLELFPLDNYVDEQFILMNLTNGDSAPDVWETYEEILKKHDPNAKIGRMDRFDYYDRAKQAYAIVMTGEKAKYANVILKKGCV